MWILIEDQATSMKWSYFGRRKNEVSDVVYELILKLKNKDNSLSKYLRMDYSGENGLFRGEC